MRALPGLLVLLPSLALAAAADEVSIGHWGNTLMVTAPTGAGEVNLGRKMHQRLTVDFKDTPLSQVAEFLRQTTSCNVVLDPKVQAADPPVSLTAQGMELGNVLKWVTTLAKVNMGFVDGAIYFSQEPYQGASKTVMYDVSDLVMPIHDFPAPELAYNVSTGAGNGGIQLLQPNKQDEERPSTSIEELEDLVRKVALKDQ
jgi:hypothetical protein